MTLRRRPVLYALITSKRPIEAVKKSLARSARVLACGRGTVEDEGALWFELTKLPEGMTPNLGILARSLTPDDCIRAVQNAVEGEGRDLARQVPLFPARVNGLWREGVEGGASPEPEAAPETPSGDDEEQISFWE